MMQTEIFFEIFKALAIAIAIYYFKKSSDSMHAIELDIKEMAGTFKVHEEKLDNMDEKIEHNIKEIDRTRDHVHRVSNEVMRLSGKHDNNLQ